MTLARAAAAVCLSILCLSGAPAAAQFAWQAASRAGLDLHAGRALFDRQWVPAPASTRAASGLGPLYNARSCAACHPGGGGGASPPNAGAPAPGLVVVLGEGSRFGRQLQTAAVAGLRAEARIEVRFEESVERYADGAEVRLRWPRFDIRPLDGAELEEGLRLSPRLAPSLRGLAVLESLADTGDTGGRGEVFGLQGGSTLERQVARALSLDLGLASPELPAVAGDCTARQADCLAAAPQVSEVGGTAFGLLLDYLRSLPPPAPAGAAPADEGGLRLFGTLGCAACHDAGAGPVRPWTDLRLHDMGAALADFTPRGEPLPTRWRTAPLWGLGERQDALLHDGRARGAEEAILWHGGEAEAARERFRALPAAERRALLDFLSGL